MRDHVLLQAIARVNRPDEDSQDRRKPAGFILDFVGIFQKLEEALAFDSQDVSGIVTGLEDLQKHFAVLMVQAKDEYLSIGKGLAGDKEVEAIVNHFRNEERLSELQEFVSELENLFEIISPDAFLRPYLADYERLMRLYAIVREALFPGLDVDKSFLRKTALLVQEHTRGKPGIGSGKVHSLADANLATLLNPEVPDTVKVVNLVKVLHQLVAEGRSNKPFLISIGEKAAAIAERFRTGQISTEDALKQLTDLSGETQEAEDAEQATGLPPEAFAVLWRLHQRGLSDQAAEQVAASAASAFVKFPLWRLRRDQEQSLRLTLHVALLRAGVEGDTTSYVDDILDSLRRVKA
jgi:type I restriction enzyme R subunit